MNVLLLGASGRIGQRVTTELLDRGHSVTGVSRSGDIDVDDPKFTSVAGDAPDPAQQGTTPLARRSGPPTTCQSSSR